MSKFYPLESGLGGLILRKKLTKLYETSIFCIKSSCFYVYYVQKARIKFMKLYEKKIETCQRGFKGAILMILKTLPKKFLEAFPETKTFHIS